MMAHFSWNTMIFVSTLRTVNFVWSMITSNTILLNLVAQKNEDNFSGWELKLEENTSSLSIKNLKNHFPKNFKIILSILWLL